MKAFRIDKPHEGRLIELETPSVGRDEALVRVSACGICGSDVDVLNGLRHESVVRYPVVPGHEFCGEIASVGSVVRGFSPGDRVAVDAIVGCGRCRHCLEGWVCHCLGGYQQLGFTRPGAMAEYVAVPERSLYKVPAGMQPSHAALTEPAACAAHAVRKAQVSPGDAVVIIGGGAIGSLALQVARLFSPQHLILVEINPEKHELGRRLGATHCLGGGEGVASAVMDLTGGRGADAVIECAGSLEALAAYFDYLGTRSRIVMVGLPPAMTVRIDFAALLGRDAAFMASNGYTRAAWMWALDLLGAGAIDAETIVTHRFPLERIEEGFDVLARRGEPAVKVMLTT